MAIITWNDSLSVKISSIDDQHMKLIDMLNDFYDNLKNKTHNDNILNLLTGMKRYTLIHFSTEEKYMVKYGYPDYQEHKKEHDLFIAKVEEMEKKFKQGKLIISFELTTFLKDWLKTHIMNTDKKYSNFFKEHGVN